jgi:hypothetical protein
MTCCCICFVFGFGFGCLSSAVDKQINNNNNNNNNTTSSKGLRTALVITGATRERAMKSKQTATGTSYAWGHKQAVVESQPVAEATTRRGSTSVTTSLLEDESFIGQKDMSHLAVSHTLDHIPEKPQSQESFRKSRSCRFNTDLTMSPTVLDRSSILARRTRSEG